MNQTMEKLQKMEEREYTALIRVLFGLSCPTPVPPDLSAPGSGFEDLEFLDPTLNDSQKDAIRFALASREVALIHGPPGVSPRNLSLCMVPLIFARQAKHTLSSSSSSN